MSNESQFKIVVLNEPYDTWEEPKAQEFFSKMVSLKFKGYKREYNYGVLPVDACDFIGTHILVCVDENQGLRPVLAYRMVSLQKARLFPIPFPALALARASGTRSHEQSIQELIEKCDEKGSDFGYIGSLSIDPEYRGRADLKEILAAVDIEIRKERNITIGLIGAVMRFKVDQYLYSLGYRPLKTNERILEPIPISFVLGEEIRLVELDGFPEVAKKYAAKHKDLWINRIEISALSKQPEKKAS